MNCVFTNESYSLSAEQLARSAMLSEMSAATGVDSVQLDDSLRDLFLIAYRYLTANVLPSAQEFAAIDYFGIKPYETYELSMVREKAMRAEMYQEGASDEYLAEAYGLHIIDRYFWEHFTPQRRVTPSTLFVGPDPVKAEWSEIEARLDELRAFTDSGNVFVAGGCIFSILFGLPTADIDLFYFGLSEEEATERLLAFRPEGRPNILRTKNAVTYYLDRKEDVPEVQVILRLYQIFVSNETNAIDN